MVKNIVYLTEAQWETLKTEGQITVGGVTHVYDADNDYRVSTDIETKITALEREVGGKQDNISDLDEIREGSALGSTSLQPDDAATAEEIDELFS